MTTDSVVGAAAPERLVRSLLAVENGAGLDPAVGVVRRVADGIVGGGLRSRLLRGEWLGHALHPVVTLAPLGFFGSTSVLDLTGGPEARDSARRLLGAGLLTVLPSVLTGLAEWRAIGRREQRVGVIHAASNATASALFLASYLVRPRRHELGVVLALLGNSAAGIGGYLGGHLTTVRKVGTRDARFGD